MDRFRMADNEADNETDIEEQRESATHAASSSITSLHSHFQGFIVCYGLCRWLQGVVVDHCLMS